MRVSGATGSVTIVWCWKASRGGSARVAHGATCQPISDRGKRCGSGITDGPWTGPTTRCSPRSQRYSGSTPRWSRTSRSCYRWIRRTCGHINTARAHGPTRSPQGALSNYKKSADEPDDHAIGRSRGGLTTKIHALTDQREAPVAVRLTAGQAGDNPQLVGLLDDKAYSHPSTRTELRSRRIKHAIPAQV